MGKVLFRIPFKPYFRQITHESPQRDLSNFLLKGNIRHSSYFPKIQRPMRIVIITGQLPHHKNLCARIDREFPVSAVLHPISDTRTFPRIFRKLMKEVSQNGPIYTSFRILGKKFGWPLHSNYKEEECRYFAQGEEEYNKKLSPKTHYVQNINSEDGIALINGINPDIVLCLGGPVYGKKLIDCCPLIINWHSGISPVYNGSTTVEFAFFPGPT